MLPGEKKFDKTQIRAHTVSNIDEDKYNEILYLYTNSKNILLTKYHDDDKCNIMTDYRFYTVYDLDNNILLPTKTYIDELRHKVLNMRYVIEELVKYFEDRTNKHPLFMHYRKSKQMLIKPGYIVVVLFKNKHDEDIFKCTYIDYADIQMLTGTLKYNSDFLKERIRNVKITDIDNERNVAMMTLYSIQENMVPPNDKEKIFTDRFTFNLSGFRNLFKLERTTKIQGLYFGYVKPFNEYSINIEYYDDTYRGLPMSCLLFNFLFSDKFGVQYPDNIDEES